MLRVLIVDDEPQTREGLREFIPWEDLQMSICGEGVDGIDALEKIFSLNPNIVLIDIKMPGMNGIDVIKHANEKGFKGKFIVFTGYSDFEYARSSINLGVSSYVLKPIDENEVIQAAKNAGECIMKEIQLQNKVNSNDKFLKNLTLGKLISGNFSTGILDNYSDLKENLLSYNSYQIAALQYKTFAKDEVMEEKLLLFIKESMDETENTDIVELNNEIVLLFKSLNGFYSLQLIERLYKKIKTVFNLEISIAVGRIVEDPYQIYQSYADAMKLLEIGYFEHGFKIVSWGEILNKFELDTAEAMKEITDFTEELYTFIEVNDKERITNIFDSLIFYFVRNEYSLDKVKGTAINMYIELKEKLKSNYQNSAEALPCTEEIIQRIYEVSNLCSLINYLNELFNRISDRICNSSNDTVIKRILNYIDKNYYKPIKLESLGEIFNYNSAYLGKIFKSYTGDNFNSYLDRVRIEKAKALLTKRNIKIYEISEKVGYSSMNYFYEKFKKHVGLSPMEFRKKLS